MSIPERLARFDFRPFRFLPTHCEAFSAEHTRRQKTDSEGSRADESHARAGSEATEQDRLGEFDSRPSAFATNYSARCESSLTESISARKPPRSQSLRVISRACSSARTSPVRTAPQPRQPHASPTDCGPRLLALLAVCGPHPSRALGATTCGSRQRAPEDKPRLPSLRSLRSRRRRGDCPTERRISDIILRLALPEKTSTTAVQSARAGAVRRPSNRPRFRPSSAP